MCARGEIESNSEIYFQFYFYLYTSLLYQLIRPAALFKSVPASVFRSYSHMLFSSIASTAYSLVLGGGPDMPDISAGNVRLVTS